MPILGSGTKGQHKSQISKDSGGAPPSSSSSSAYPFQLPALEIPSSSLTAGTSIPPPPPSPPPSPPQSLDSPNPLRSHPPSSHSLSRQFSAPLNGPTNGNGIGNGSGKGHSSEAGGASDHQHLSSINPAPQQAGASAGATSNLRPSTTPNTHPKRSQSDLTGLAGSSGASGLGSPQRPAKRTQLRRLFSLRGLVSLNRSSDSLATSSSHGNNRSPVSPTSRDRLGSPGQPSLRSRNSGTFWRRGSSFVTAATLERDATATGDSMEGVEGGGKSLESQRKRMPPPMIPELTSLTENGNGGSRHQSDGKGERTWLGGEDLFKDIK